ncbi:MAG: hypothetical protein JSU64_06310 [candidate division WOR-3 bacterium]|nr:MAG: hypothetical protein JSU64_06310 [candidate division WOR-3 bacterium]
MHGRGWREHAQRMIPRGYVYVGPCHCGRGPNAYYQDRFGHFVHARHIPRWTSDFGLKRDSRAELDALRKEKENLERRIQELQNKMGAD